MMELSYRRHRFPPVVIQHAVWLYLRFTLSYRNGRGSACRARVRRLLPNGPELRAKVRIGDRAAVTAAPSRPSDRWHLDEMVVRIAGKRIYLWRAVDHE